MSILVGPAEHLRDELYWLMKLKHDARELTLLNVGTDREGEYHWRFRTASGQIILLKMEVESPSGG